MMRGIFRYWWHVLTLICLLLIIGSCNLLGFGFPGLVDDEDVWTVVFRDDFDGTSVDTSAWTVGTWSEHGGQLSAERCYVSDGMLHMVFINDSVDGYLGAAIQTKQEFLYGRWEARLRPTSQPGVLDSFFTIDWDDATIGGSTSDGTKQEIDIELLTNSFGVNQGETHLAIHEEGETSWETNPDVPVDFNPSDDFHIWGFEITPTHVEWFVDDASLGTYTYGDPGQPVTIDRDYMLKLNTWSSVSWIGGPPTPDVECVYLIDWIQFSTTDG